MDEGAAGVRGGRLGAEGEQGGEKESGERDHVGVWCGGRCSVVLGMLRSLTSCVVRQNSKWLIFEIGFIS